MSASPLDWLRQGQEILDPVFVPRGYRFELEEPQQGSGGEFAIGYYRKGEQSVELHFRWALGIVKYRIADDSLDHKQYMGLLGVADQTAYPGFSDDPLDGFRHLRSDLERFGEPFLSGKERNRFPALVREAKENERHLRHLP
ncbi:MAG TPA: hypothetical protein VHK65_16190 [Candidatus Dormibacteraeota bacterium]|nr:hypothetical protein [Candidatus Dormibacteraeota bacterium]